MSAGERKNPQTSTARRYWAAMAGAGALALAVRTLNVLVLRPTDQDCAHLDPCFAINGDALYSHLQGELLSQGHGFASSFAYWLFGEIQPGAGDPPLYPLYLALVSSLHGSGGFGGQLAAVVAVLIAVGATWLWARRRGTRAARTMALVTAVGATWLVAVSLLPGLGRSTLGVQSGGGSVVELPQGETVQVASIDVSAVVSHRLASGLAGTVGVLLLGEVARRLAGLRAGVLAAVLAALHPLLWINDAMVLSESLYVPLIAAVMLVAYRWWDHPNPGNAAMLGGFIGLAALARAEAMLLFGFLVLPLVWGRRGEIGARESVRQVALAWTAGLALLVPWFGYNQARFTESALMTSQTGAVLSAGSCDVAYEGEFAGYYGANCFQQYVDDGWTAWPDPRAEESVRDVLSREAALRYIRENAEDLPRVMLLRVGRMWDVYKPGQNVTLNYNIEGRGRLESWAGLGAYAVLAPLAVVGVWRLRRDGRPVSPLVAQAASVTMTAALTFGVTRYRVPADAAIVVAAAIALNWILEARRPTARRLPVITSAQRAAND